MEDQFSKLHEDRFASMGSASANPFRSNTNSGTQAHTQPPSGSATASHVASPALRSELLNHDYSANRGSPLTSLSSMNRQASRETSVSYDSAFGTRGSVGSLNQQSLQYGQPQAGFGYYNYGQYPAQGYDYGMQYQQYAGGYQYPDYYTPAVPEAIWMYIDSSGKQQGPYASSLFSSWVACNYFPDNSLIKRVTDQDFVQLKHLRAATGNPNPFLENLTSEIYAKAVKLSMDEKSGDKKEATETQPVESKQPDLAAQATSANAADPAAVIGTASAGAAAPSAAEPVSEAPAPVSAPEPETTSAKPEPTQPTQSEPEPAAKPISEPETRPVQPETPVKQRRAKPRKAKPEKLDLDAALADMALKESEQAQSQAQSEAQIAPMPAPAPITSPVTPSRVPAPIPTEDPWKVPQIAVEKINISQHRKQELEEKRRAQKAREAQTQAQTQATSPPPPVSQTVHGWASKTTQTAPPIKSMAELQKEQQARKEVRAPRPPVQSAPAHSASPLRSVPAPRVTIKPKSPRKPAATTVTGITQSASLARPTDELINWAKYSFKDLAKEVDQMELLNLFLSLPANASAKEFIADSIFSYSRSLDGRRFAQDFLDRKKYAEKSMKPGETWEGVLKRFNPDAEPQDPSFKVVTKKRSKPIPKPDFL